MFGAIFVAFSLLRFVVIGVIDLFTGPGARSIDAYWPLLLTMLAESLLGFALGLVLCRILVFSIKFRELVYLFYLLFHLYHLYRCGGFRSLGDLCLWNALLVTVPAIFLGIWVVLAPSLLVARETSCMIEICRAAWRIPRHPCSALSVYFPCAAL